MDTYSYRILETVIIGILASAIRLWLAKYGIAPEIWIVRALDMDNYHIYLNIIGYSLIGVIALIGMMVIEWKRGNPLWSFNKKYIPLKAAAIQCYEKTRMADKYYQTADEKTRYHALQLLTAIPIYGHKPPSALLERIPADSMSYYSPNEELNSLHYIDNKLHPEWNNLQVKASELKRFIASIKKTPFSNLAGVS